MKRLFVSAVALSCLLVLGASYANADHFHRGRSGVGISINYGSGYNGFNVGYNRGHRQPYYGGGHGGGGYYGGGYGGGYPVYRSTPVYSVPIYGGNYGGGHHHHHHHCW